MEKISRKKPLVFLDVSIDGDPVERMIFEASLPRLLKTFMHFVQEKKVSALKLGSCYTTKGPFFTVLSKDMLLRRETFFGTTVNLEKVYMTESFQMTLQN